jgi:MarR family transcriptional regulator, transcriptional regulator for hemolysin
LLLEIDDPQLEFVRLFGLVSRRWRSCLDERLKPTGLTLSRWVVLFWLSQSDTPLNQTELAQRAAIEGPTLVRQLHLLEEQGLIERRPVPGDKRAKSIALTVKAEPLIIEINEIASAMRHEFMDCIGPGDLAIATAVLRHVYDQIP